MHRHFAALTCLLLAAGTGLCQEIETAWPTSQDPEPRWHVQADYLIWFLRDSRVPPLLTSNPVILYGHEKIETERHEIPGRHFGVRLGVSGWLDDEESLGIEVRCFFLERDSSDFKLRSDGSLPLARPFIDPDDGSLQAEVIAGPVPGGGVLSGAFNAFTKIELFGEEGHFIVPLAREDGWRLDFLAGVHCLQMREQLKITSSSKLLPEEAILFGTTDRFRTVNRFYGGEIGLRGECSVGRWFVNVEGKLALGGTDQSVKTLGERTFHTPTERTVQPVGLYVQPSNAGDFRQGQFDIVTELGINVGYSVTDSLRAHVGYTFLYWTNPVRPGDQIDLAIDLDQQSTRPAIPFRDDFFWAQGLNAGIELRW